MSQDQKARMMRVFGLAVFALSIASATAVQAGPMGMGRGGGRHGGGGHGKKTASTMKPYPGHWANVQGETDAQRKAYNKRFGF